MRSKRVTCAFENRGAATVARSKARRRCYPSYRRGHYVSHHVAHVFCRRGFVPRPIDGNAEKRTEPWSARESAARRSWRSGKTNREPVTTRHTGCGNTRKRRSHLKAFPPREERSFSAAWFT
ncbi:hypothetical protein WN55_09310 [Dufourea novaeangliae]|uniref:Uncharacterized protein n=1 Tax=Dufourea novaeangliae TaxID=178035 RepID=A0A154P8Z4_DUFNO|nr:hypothetical protein WN55_09310 [Dufourea novaeangliae]